MNRTLALLLLLVPCALCEAQELGRLFFSPAERETLDARRSGKVDRAAATAPTPQRVDGYVHGSGGRLTLWVNGKMQRSPDEKARGAVDQAEARALIRDGEARRAR